MARIVVALGGNALSLDGKASASDQQAVASQTVAELIKLIQAGHDLVVVHGNGPQIGNIILHEEAINTEKVPTMPVDTCGAMSQGQIGYWLQKAFYNQFYQLGINRPVASIVTQVLVDQNDPAFQNPSKPIGPFYTEAEAKELAATKGITVKEDSGRGWRKVIPSPRPIHIVESEFIKLALKKHAILVAAGGGGIPVSYQNGQLSGLEAVIDKDFAAAKLADIIKADTLLILTAVESVKINFGQPDEQSLTKISTKQAAEYIQNNQFGAGSMLPKVEAALQFIGSNKKRRTIITTPQAALAGLKGQAGTTIVL